MIRSAIFTALTLLTPAAAHAQVDPSFAQCAACHTVKAGRNRIGPSLFGVVGRKKAAVAQFAYSPAMKAQKGVWSATELDRYIVNPRKAVPGTRMIYAGMADPAKRARLIAWLGTQK